LILRGLGCKLILGLVEGVSCRLQSRDSPLDTLLCSIAGSDVEAAQLLVVVILIVKVLQCL